MKTLSLVFLGLLAAKAVSSLQARGPARLEPRLAIARGALYATILTLVILGARSVGNDLAAEFYSWASMDNLSHSQIRRAYDNALRAVTLRPGVLRYWQVLARAKFVQQQFRSVLEDQPVFQSLSEKDLEEEDATRFAFCHFSLAQYDKVLALTGRLIQDNHYYPLPYVLQGMAYTAQQRYPEAERTFLAVLQIFPSQEEAVEGLAHVYFLEGDHARSIRVLNETTKFPFPPEVRKRFEDLKAFYAQ